MHGRVGIGAQVLLTEGCPFVHLGYADQHVILTVPLPCLPRVQGAPVLALRGSRGPVLGTLRIAGPRKVQGTPPTSVSLASGVVKLPASTQCLLFNLETHLDSVWLACALSVGHSPT